MRDPFSAPRGPNEGILDPLSAPKTNPNLAVFRTSQVGAGIAPLAGFSGVLPERTAWKEAQAQWPITASPDTGRAAGNLGKHHYLSRLLVLTVLTQDTYDAPR